VRCKEEVEAQRSRWIFYETFNFLEIIRIDLHDF